MPLSRRALIAGLSASLAIPRLARAASVTDATGRALILPDKVTRIFPAGPPAAIMLYTLAPDLILDVGMASGTFVSLAERVQAQTGIPYALLDGRFDATAESFRTLGEMTGWHADAEKLSHTAQYILTEIPRRIADIPLSKRPRVYYARGPRGLETGLGGLFTTHDPNHALRAADRVYMLRSGQCLAEGAGGRDAERRTA